MQLNKKESCWWLASVSLTTCRSNSKPHTSITPCVTRNIISDLEQKEGPTEYNIFHIQILPSVQCYDTVSFTNLKWYDKKWWTDQWSLGCKLLSVLYFMLSLILKKKNRFWSKMTSFVWRIILFFFSSAGEEGPPGLAASKPATSFSIFHWSIT